MKLDSSDSETISFQTLNELSHQIKELQKNFDSGASLGMLKGKATSEEKLSDKFVSSILKASKPGRRYDQS